MSKKSPGSPEAILPMLDPTVVPTVSMSRHVGSWYYILTAATAVGAVWLAHRRNRERLAVVVLMLGIALNLGWELALTLVWGRTYHVAGVPVVQLTYQALTEFGPLMLVLMLALEATGRVAGLDQFSERRARSTTKDGHILAIYTCVTVIFGAVLVTGAGDGGTVAVQRHVTWTFFGAEALLAVLVFGGCLLRRSQEAIGVFLLVGALNVVVEFVALATGLRTYTGLSPRLPAGLLSVLIGYSEGGTAAAITWTAVSSQVSLLGSLPTSWHSATDQPSTHEDSTDP